jgi:hypothetical protein
VLTDFIRQQVAAFASLPISLARLLAALADAAEASVGLLQQLDERAAATNRVMHSFEDPLVRIAEAVDASLVEQLVDALSRLPVVLSRASAISDRAEGLLSGLEAPVRALGPLTQALDVGRLGGLVDRLEESIPGLIRLPDTEHEVRRLRETLDRMYRVVDDVQGRFGAFPGAGLLLRRAEPVPVSPPPKATKARKKGRSPSGGPSGSSAEPTRSEEGGA